MYSNRIFYRKCITNCGTSGTGVILPINNRMNDLTCPIIRNIDIIDTPVAELHKDRNPGHVYVKRIVNMPGFN